MPHGPNPSLAAKDQFQSRGSMRYLIPALLGALLLTACQGFRGGPIPYEVKDFGAPDSPATQIVEANYTVAPMDTVKVSVFRVQELSGDYEVDLMGNLSMPLIGTVKAADLTMAQLDEAITTRLSEKYLQNPDVNIALKSSTRRNVTVDGAVNSPGMFPINGPTTLLQTIAMARGVNPEGNPRRVAIFRQIGGKRMAAAFDLAHIRQGKMEDPQVYSGDIVVVDGSGIKAIQNQILNSLPIVGLFNPLIF